MDGIRDSLPIEDRENGLYINRPFKGMPGVEVVTITHSEGERYLVPAEDFMEMQKERDDYRRTLALVNELAHRKLSHEGRLIRLLERAGFTRKDAETMSGIIREFARAG